MIVFKSLLSSFILLCISPLPASTASLDVKLNSGIFRGISTTNGTEKWLGIPYALPPIGSLRFKAPVPVNSSNTLHDASTFGNACPQPPSSSLGAPISEDCLFLNVHAVEQSDDVLNQVLDFPVQQYDGSVGPSCTGLDSCESVVTR